MILYFISYLVSYLIFLKTQLLLRMTKQKLLCLEDFPMMGKHSQDTGDAFCKHYTENVTIATVTQNSL